MAARTDGQHTAKGSSQTRSDEPTQEKEKNHSAETDANRQPAWQAKVESTRSAQNQGRSDDKENVEARTEKPADVSKTNAKKQDRRCQPQEDQSKRPRV